MTGECGHSFLFVRVGATAEGDASAAEHGVSADVMVGVNHRDGGAVIARHDSSGESRGAGADDDHVGGVVKANLCGGGGGCAQAGGGGGAFQEVSAVHDGNFFVHGRGSISGAIWFIIARVPACGPGP